MKIIRSVILLLLSASFAGASLTIDWTISGSAPEVGTNFTLNISVDADGKFILNSVENVPAAIQFTADGTTGIPALAGKMFSLNFSSLNGSNFMCHTGNSRIGIAGGTNAYRFDSPDAVVRITAGLSQISSNIVFRLAAYERMNSVSDYVIGLKNSAGIEVFSATNATQFADIAPALSGGGTDWFDFRAADGSAGGWGSLTFDFSIKDAYTTPLKLSSIFSDGCVLQRDKTVPVWGTSEPGETVTVTVKDQTKTAFADAAGNWRVELDAESAGGAYRMIVSGERSTAIVLNVWFGDVWLLTGQSNMFLMLRSHFPQFENYYSNAVPDSVTDDYDNLRFAVVNVVEAETPQQDAEMSQVWSRWQADKLSTMSTVGYFFARAVRQTLDANGMGNIPLGIIKVCKGATAIEEWMSAEALADLPEAMVEDPSRQPSGYYNGMIAPIEPYAIKGVLWHQSGGNSGDIMRAQQYPMLFSKFAESWRAARNDSFPIYFAQKEPYRRYLSVPADSPDKGNYLELSWVREMQTACLAVPDTKMTCIIDYGFQNHAHPPYKDILGDRFARIALNDTYGITMVDRGPVMRDVQFAGKDVIITFNEVAGGLETSAVDAQPDAEEIAEGLLPVSVSADELAGFALCGDDQVFYWATSAEIISSNQVKISCADVPAPVAVRYAWQSFPRCNLYNSAGLPAEPFRTDSFSYLSSSGAENRQNTPAGFSFFVQ